VRGAGLPEVAPVPESSDARAPTTRFRRFRPVRPTTMKDNIHPNYRWVVFKDRSADFAFLTRSTIRSNEKIVWEDGQEYPLVSVDISSASHPFFTGKQKLVDAMGRVEKFQKKFGKGYGRGGKKAAEESSEAAAES
jgi:large subunit ribosomal protein L31